MIRLPGYRFLLLPIVGQSLIRYLHGHDPEISSVHSTIGREPYYIHPGATIYSYPCHNHASMRSLILALHDTSLYPDPAGRHPAVQSSGATLSPGIKDQLEIYPAYFFHLRVNGVRFGIKTKITNWNDGPRTPKLSRRYQ